MKTVSPHSPRGPALAACLALVLGALAAGVLPAFALELDRLEVDNRGGRLMVRFGVSATDLNRVARTVEDGELASLEVLARLSPERDGATPVRSGTFDSSLTFALDTRSYALTLPGRADPLWGRRLEVLLSEGWSLAEIDMGPWDGLAPGTNYVLRLDMRLKRPEPPQWLRALFFFVPWDADDPYSCTMNMAY